MPKRVFLILSGGSFVQFDCLEWNSIRLSGHAYEIVTIKCTQNSARGIGRAGGDGNLSMVDGISWGHCHPPPREKTL